MEKIIEISGQKVKFKATAATPIHYRNMFRRDMLQDMQSLYEENEEKKILRIAVAELSPRERVIIEMRYGLIDGNELTQKEVADNLGISQSYISRLEKKIMLRLKKRIEEKI